MGEPSRSHEYGIGDETRQLNQYRWIVRIDRRLNLLTLEEQRSFMEGLMAGLRLKSHGNPDELGVGQAEFANNGIFMEYVAYKLKRLGMDDYVCALENDLQKAGIPADTCSQLG